MALPFTDTFTDTNGTALETHDSGWSADQGAADIQSNTAQGNSSGAYSFYRWTTDTPDADQSIKGIMEGDDTNGSIFAGITGRMTDTGANQDFYAYWSNFGTQYLSRFDNDSETTLSSTATQITSGDEFELECNGTTMTCRRNASTSGAPTAQTDSTYSSGAGGLIFYSDGTNIRVDSITIANLGGGSQSISPTLITQSETLFSVTPTPGSISISPSIITQSETLFDVTPTPGSVSISPSIITQSETLFDVTPTPGSVSISPTLITQAETLFGVTPSSGQTLVGVTIITENQTLFDVTPAPGSVSIAPALITQAETLFDVTPAAGDIIAVTLITETGQLFAVTPAPGSVSIAPSLISQAETLFDVTPAPSIDVGLGLLVDNETLFDVTPAPGAFGPAIGLILQNETLFSITAVDGSVIPVVAGRLVVLEADRTLIVKPAMRRLVVEAADRTLIVKRIH